MTDHLVGASHRNLFAAGRGFAATASDGDQREFGPVLASTANVPIPSFNRVLVTDPDPGEDLERAVSWMADQEFPFWVTASSDAVPAVEAVSSTSLERQVEQPGMVRPSLADMPDPNSPATITEVTTEAEIGDAVTASADAFGSPESVIADLVSPSMLETDLLRTFVGYVDGEPVACGQLVTSGETAGVYTIGVREPYRRQGIGEAMTWTVLHAGREDGCHHAVLQSSEMGVGLYEKMGFETVETYTQFASTE